MKQYLRKLGPRFHRYHNAQGRAIPDVAAQLRSFLVYDYGFQNEAISDTSASSPILAAVIDLLNDSRKSQGKPPLGF